MRYPITKKSYGIICGRYNKLLDKIEFLLIKKRYTFNYSDFILKHYSTHDDTKLLYLFNGMSHEEKLDIVSLDFGRMWYRLFLTTPDKNTNVSHLDKYVLCKAYFEKKFLHDGGAKLRELICKSNNLDYIWEIPKGRKATPQEKDIACAMRELEEETGVSSNNYLILDDNPIRTSIISNGIKYIATYYLAIYIFRKCTPKIQYNNYQQLSEVSRIDWMAVDKINIIDQSKRLYLLLKQVNKVMSKKYKIRK